MREEEEGLCLHEKCLRPLEDQNIESVGSVGTRQAHLWRKIKKIQVMYKTYVERHVSL